jgi:hypothetical protein
MAAPEKTLERIAQEQHRHRIAVFETIGCALATLRRLDYVWYDEDVRERVTSARSTLSVAQSRVKQRIDEPLVERTSV